MIDNKHLKPELLIVASRGNTIERLHYGWLCIINKDLKIIYKRGNVFNKAFLRSSAKPIQALPVIENNIEVSDNELAIICASHSASRQHLRILTKLMKRTNITLLDLHCGSHSPTDEDEKNNLVLKNLSPTPLHNNCSGKHLGMLAVCKKKGWNIKNYTSSNHPLQKAILKRIEELSETKDINIAIDGCSLPTLALPIRNIAVMFSNFTQEPNKNYKRIIKAMTTHPYLIGGINQLDSEIIKNSNGKLLAKVGAEGIIIVAYKGNSLVVKIADGSQQVRSFTTLKILTKLGWLKRNDIKNSILEEILTGEIKNHNGVTIGKLEFVN